MSSFPKKLDLNGHFGETVGCVVDLEDTKDEWSEQWNRHLSMFRSVFKLEATLAEKLAEEGEIPMTDEILGTIVSLKEASYYLPRCPDCGDRLDIRCEGDSLLVGNACSEAGGMKAYDIHLAVTSGKIVFANDLRGLVAVDNTGIDVNTASGRKKLTKAAEAVGLCLVSVGKSDPSVYRDGDSLVVSRGPKTGRLGQIETSLWWYCAMDYQMFLDRCAVRAIDPSSIKHFTVDVSAGIYAFSDEIASGDESVAVFSNIRSVDVDPPELLQERCDHATTLEDSAFWKFFNRRGASVPELTLDYTAIGRGLTWLCGDLRSLSGDHPVSRFGSLRGRASRNTVEDIPPMPGFDARYVYPCTRGYPGIMGDVPADANVYFLAAGMMVYKAALADKLEIRKVKTGFPDDPALAANLETREAITAMLDLACSVATARGLWKDGTMARVFAEIEAAVAAKVGE